jgi:raffinose/stachyose/melibiose transport system permease protein
VSSPALPTAIPAPPVEGGVAGELTGSGTGRRGATRAAERPPGEPRRIGYLYLLPAGIVFGLFVLLPLVHAGWLSLFAWDGVSQGEWVGLANYKEMVTDPALRRAFLHAFVLIGFYSGIPVLIGLLIAGLLARVQVRGLALFRTVLFLPQVIAMVVVAVMWRMIYDPQTGAANEILRKVGLGGLAQDWLGDFSRALGSVGLVGTWVMYGLAMVLLTAGVQKIPSSLYDAARVDGAGLVREFFAVTLPALRGEIAVAVTLTMIYALRSFDLVYITTRGGPGDSTSVPAFQVYDRAFNSGQVGSAAAIGLTLTVLIFLISVGINRVAERGAR